MGPWPAWWWPFLPSWWLASLVNLGVLESNGVAGGTVNVGPYFQATVGGGGGSSGSSNQLSSAIGDFSVSWVGVGIITTGEGFQGSPAGGALAQSPSAVAGAQSSVPVVSAQRPAAVRSAQPSPPPKMRQYRSATEPRRDPASRSRSRSRVTVIQ